MSKVRFGNRDLGRKPGTNYTYVGRPPIAATFTPEELAECASCGHRAVLHGVDGCRGNGRLCACDASSSEAVERFRAALG
jgi:hypothetical protein